MACAKAGLFYSGNKSAVDTAMKLTPQVINLLRDLQRRSPTLFKKLMQTAARELLVNLPSGMTAEDVAFFIGRVIKGAAAAPSLTFGALMKIVGTVGTIVTVTHLPSLVTHAVAGAAAAKAAELRRNLAAAGYTVTEAEARTILNEVMLQKEMVAKLRQLDVACKALLPSLEVLKRAYSAMP
jgi:hypothetical protein